MNDLNAIEARTLKKTIDKVERLAKRELIIKAIMASDDEYPKMLRYIRLVARPGDVEKVRKALAEGGAMNAFTDLWR
jgi:hypothetical protein